MVVEVMEGVAPIASFYGTPLTGAAPSQGSQCGTVHGKALEPIAQARARPAIPAPVESLQPGARPRPRAGATEQARSRLPACPQLFHIHLADSAATRAEARRLLQRRYAWRGYAQGSTEQPERHENEGRISLVAATAGTLIGTMGLCLDRTGRLPADENFGDRLAILRRQGRRLCEPTRLAIDAGMSKRVFAALIHVSYLYATRLHDYTDYVIEVNPRHVAFYQRMLGFAHFGPERPCSRVGAPAVLLRLPLDHMGAQIARWGGSAGYHGERQAVEYGEEPVGEAEKKGAARAGFYAHFFSRRDEQAICERLAALCCKGEAA